MRGFIALFIAFLIVVAPGAAFARGHGGGGGGGYGGGHFGGGGGHYGGGVHFGGGYGGFAPRVVIPIMPFVPRVNPWYNNSYYGGGYGGGYGYAPYYPPPYVPRVNPAYYPPAPPPNYPPPAYQQPAPQQATPSAPSGPAGSYTRDGDALECNSVSVDGKQREMCHTCHTRSYQNGWQQKFCTPWKTSVPTKEEYAPST